MREVLARMAETGETAMKESWWSKVKLSIRMFICALYGHEYGCCDDVFRTCAECECVRKEDWMQ